MVEDQGCEVGVGVGVGVGIGIGIGIEGSDMALGHERLDAYRATIEYVGWAPP
jgi:hypothetical protein